MAAYHRIYDSLHLQGDCQERVSAPEPYAWQSSMGYLYHFLVGLDYRCRLGTTYFNMYVWFCGVEFCFVGDWLGRICK